MALVLHQCSNTSGFELLSDSIGILITIQNILLIPTVVNVSLNATNGSGVEKEDADASLTLNEISRQASEGISGDTARPINLLIAFQPDILCDEHR